MNNNRIGIIDFDLLSQKKLCEYNLGVLIVSSYYKLRGIKTRLIINLTYDNLCKYDKIYIFKDYKNKQYPINLIKNYYSLPIEEYGEGFDNKPILPDLPELIYTSLDNYIYLPLLQYMKNGGDKFTIDKNFRTTGSPSKIFFEHNGELLIREPQNHRGIIDVFDSPELFFTTEIGYKKMTEIIKYGRIRFIKPVRIGNINPSNYELLFNSQKFIRFKHNLFSLEGDKYLDEFISWIQKNARGEIILNIKQLDGEVRKITVRGGTLYDSRRNKNKNNKRFNVIAKEQDILIGNERKDREETNRRYQYIRNRDKKQKQFRKQDYSFKRQFHRTGTGKGKRK